MSRGPKRVSRGAASAGARRRRRDQPDAGDTDAAADEDDGRVSRTETVVWVVLLLAAVAALAWKHATLFFLSWTDEQIHFYVAHRMVEGAVLYRDIQSARPPLVLLPLAWLIRLGCSPLLAGRALVFGSQLAIAGLLAWGGWRLVSWRTGALAALLFLASPEAFSRIHYTGIHLAALGASACALFALADRPLRAGVCLGLSVAADQHGLAMCALAGLVILARRRRDLLPFAAAAGVVCLVVFGGVWAGGGRHLWRSLVGIHLFHFRLGQGTGGQFWELFQPWLYEHGYLFAGAALAAAMLALRAPPAASTDARPPAARVVRGLLLVVVGHMAVVLAMAETAFLYFVVMAPLLSLLAAIGFGAASRWWRRQSRSSPRRGKRASRIMAAGTVAVVALTAGGWAAARAHREGLDERPYSFLPHVLHGEVSRFHRLDVAGRVARDPVMPGQGTIFGEPTIVSAVALASGKRVSGELADLNPSWIEAGAITRQEIVSRIEHDEVRLVITPPSFLVLDPYFRSYLDACYDQPTLFAPPESGPGAGLPDVLVFRRASGKPSCPADAQPSIR